MTVSLDAPLQMVTVLGSTGSIGKNTLDVLARHPERYRVFALSAARQVDLMLAQCAAFRPLWAVMTDPDAARVLAERLQAEGLPTQVRSGALALEDIASDPQVDAVMAAIVGAAGLAPCLAAARAGKRLLLANKEALVVGGDVFMRAVQEGGATLLPIDSEHSAIFQSLPEDPSTWAERIDRIILTASGGPFRQWAPDRLSEVTPDEACAHPNWVMGRKISVDSATMMNKALELIEARHLFGVRPDQLEVVIHPQSVVHSMVQYLDGSVLAQLGTPDMRVPIAYGLSWPDRMVSGASRLDFSSLQALTFESIEDHRHPERYPGLKLAWTAMVAPSGSCAVLNAANEVAVEAFLHNRIRFDQIHAINEQVLQTWVGQEPQDLSALLSLDQQTRQRACAEVQKRSG